MKKNRKIIMLIITIFTIAFMVVPIISKATINPSDFEPEKPSQSDVTKIVDIANPIIGTIKVAGIVIAVIILTIIGIKFMTGSIEEKAEYKKVLPGYFIGAIMVVAITQFLAVIIDLVTNSK